MSEVALPKSLEAQLQTMRAERDAVEPTPTDNTKLLTLGVVGLKLEIGKLCYWAQELGRVATDKHMPTNVTIVDGGIRTDGTYMGKVVDTGWKITIDTSIGGGGDLSYQYIESAPAVSSRGVLLTAAKPDTRSRLLAFKSAHGEDETRMTLITTKQGIVHHGDGFHNGSLADINWDTYPLPQFLDTWSTKTGILTLQDDLVLFADKVQTYGS